MPDTDTDHGPNGGERALETHVVQLRAIAANAAECERCAVSLRDRLTGYRGVEVAHLNGEQTLVLHYDPELTTLSTVERALREEGLRLDARFKHVLFAVEGMDCLDCAVKFENLLRSLDGVIWAEINYAPGTLKLEYDSALIDESTIVAQARRAGHELVPIQGASLKLDVTGLDCPDCAQHLQEALGAIEGITFATVDFTGGTVIVSPVPDDATLALVHRAITDAGYQVRRARTPRARRDAVEWLREEWPLVASGALILVAAIAAAIGLGPVSDAAFLVAIGIGGFRIARAGVRAFVATRALSIDVLMTIAVIGAIAIGELTEAAAVVFLFALGEALEGYTMDRARRAIRRLLDLTPRQAVRLRQGIEERVPVDSLAPGDVVLVAPGENVPVDGVILEGQSTLNEATVTGESVPVAKGPGDDVFAGTTNGGSAVRIEARQAARDSTVARIVRMVEEAQARRAPSQRLVESFSRYYTPAVVLTAAAIVTVPPLLGLGSFSEWLYRGLVLLVISCPCALVISTPVTVVSAIARAARSGVIIKGGAYLEAIGQVRLLAMDKTGTLTSGRPTVQAVVPVDGIGEDELLALVAAIEARSNHPLAAAVVREAHRRSLPLTASVQDMEEYPGHGVTATVDGESHCAGRTDFVLDHCRVVAGPAEATLRRMEAEGRTVIAVAREGKLLGFVGLQDVLRPEARQATEALKRLGLRLVMLTGDNERTAAAIAAEAGVDEHLAGLRPEDKQQAVTDLRQRYGHVAMVGDGVNDAPALAASSVGIAMGAAGSHAALETADVVLMADDLSKLPGALELGLRARRTIVANVTFAIVFKALFLALAVAGVATLWMAVIADVGASLIVILNGMRLLRARM